MNSRLLVLVGVPLVGTALVLCAVTLRNRPEPEPMKPKKSAAARSAAPVEWPIQPAPPPPPPPKLAPEKTVAVAMDEARLQTTYQNYRTALATGNRVLADTLQPVLLRDRKAALRLAEHDLAQARQDFDRAVAEQAVNALRR